MKLHLNSTDHNTMVRSCRLLSHGYQIGIGEDYFDSSLILTPEKLEMWGVRKVSELSATHFDDLCRHRAEVFILGTGRDLIFPDPATYQALMKSGTGMEVMDTAAACRTYNVLLADGRNVVAGLIV